MRSLGLDEVGKSVWLIELIKGRAGTELPSGQKVLGGGVPLQITVNNSGQECPKHKPNLTQRTGAQEVKQEALLAGQNWFPRGPRHLQVIRDICKLLEELHHRMSHGNPNNLSCNETRTWSPLDTCAGRGENLTLGGKWGPLCGG